MVEQVNAIARLWWDWSAAMFWQVSLLIVLVGCIDVLIRRWAWPQLRYALWSLILIKLLLPPTLSLPSAVVPELQSVVRQGLARLEVERPQAQSPGEISDFGLQIADLPSGIALPAGVSGLPLRESEISDLKSQVSDSYLDSALAANPQSEITSLRAKRGNHNLQFAWPVYALAAWLAGTLVLGLWLFLRLHSLCGRHAYRAAAASLPQSFYNQMADCASRLGLRHVPEVVVTKKLSSPAVFGVLRPVLLLPKGYLSKLSRKDTEHMLLHELAHIERGDLVMHSLYMLLQIGYWYNPLLWLVRRQVHHLRELSCDMTVANLLRERTAAYRQTLLETARRLLSTSVDPGLGLLGLFEDSNRLLVRLNWLTKPTWRYRTMKRAIVVTIAALMIACVLPMARAQERISHQQEPVVKRVDDPLAQQMAQLEAQLQKLMEQQKALQNQLRALAEQRHQAAAGTTQPHPNLPDPMVAPQGQNIDKRIERRIERRLEGEIEGQVEEEIVRAQAEAQRAQIEAVAAERKAQIREAAEAQGRQWEEWGGQMRAWGEQMRHWQNSDEMKRWQQQVQKNVEANLDEAGPMPPMPAMPAMPPMGEAPERRVVPMPHEGAIPHGAVPEGAVPHSTVPGRMVTPMPHPQVAPTPQVHVETVPHEIQHASGVTQGRRPGAAAPTVPHDPVHDPIADVPNGDRIITLRVPEQVKLTQLLDMVGKHTGMSWVYDPQVVTGEISLQLEGGREGTMRVRDLYGMLQSALQSHNLAMVRGEGDVVKIVPASARAHDAGQVIPCGEYVVESWPAGAALQVENNLGSVAVEGVEGSTCTVKATARIKGGDRAEAEGIARGIKVYVTPTEGRVQVRVEVPEGLSEEQRNRILIDFQIFVPDKAPVKVAQKVGGIRLASLGGDVKAMTDVGSIEARQLRGDVALQTNVGSIAFVAPQELSAKVRAHANIGAISSDLPLEITRTTALPGSGGQGALGSNATGVLGDGQSSVDLTTNVGSIAVRRDASHETPATL